MALEFLKDAYYSLEDRIGKTGIIVLALAIIGVITIVAWLLLQPPIEMKTVQLNIVDSSGRALEGVAVKYTIGVSIEEKTTNADGQISFNAPLNSNIEIEIAPQTIEGKEFEAKRESFSVEGTVFRQITLKAKEPESTERTIVFQGADGARITGKQITVRLSCANGFSISPSIASDTDKDGTIRITQPAECDALTAIVIGPAEFKQKTILLDAEPKTAVLETTTVDSQKGTLRVKVKNSSGELATDTSFTVTIRSPNGAKEDEKTTGVYGEAVFTNIPAGNYNVTVLDESNVFAIANVSGASVSAGQTKEITVVVSKNIKRNIKVTVLDKSSSARVQNATVQLFDSEGTVVGEDNTGDSGETIVFSIIENDSFSVLVMHEEYVYEKKETGLTEENITILLEKCTPENCGIVEVKVIDEDFKPVEGAKAALRNFEDDFLATEYKTTDFNGTVLFRGIKTGKYYAYASKEPVAFADNKEDAREINLRETIEFVVQLIVGTATLKLSAIDIDENPVAEAEAEIFSSDGKSLGRVPLPNGSAEYSIKAGRKVFVVFKHADFAAVQTLPRQLWPDREFEFKAIMPAKAISGSLKVEHEGIFNEANEKTTMFEAGKKYLAVFKVTVPENKGFEKIGLHFRVGDEKRLENEPLAIVSGIVGNPVSIIKGLTFNAPLGYQTDSQNLTEGDAKWISMETENTESGAFFFGVEFRVKKTTLPSALLTMHYRAYGIDASGRQERHPADDELGSSENTQFKQALYAKTIDNLRFYEGEAPDCEEEFCYSGEWFFDNREKLYLNEPYALAVTADYNFHFMVTNNSERAFENAELFIQNYLGDESAGEYKFKAYVVEDSSGKKTRLYNASLDKIEKISIGQFLKGTSISGNLLFETKKIAPTKIYLYIIESGRRVFEKTIEFKILSNKKMVISVEPDIIPAFVENKLKVKVVQEKESGNLEVTDALVTVKKTSPDKTEALFSGKTNALGIAEFTIPASSPKTILRFNAEKTGFFAEPFEKEIVSEILKFDPASVSAELDTRNITEMFFDEKITNLTGIDLAIESIQPAGKLKRVLDISGMLNYSSNFLGEKIVALGTTEFEKLFLVKLNAEAARELAQNASLDGNFWVTVKETGTGSRFDFMVPLHVGITIADLPKEACIIISKSEWLASTQGNRATLEFEVQNNCEADSQSLALENLMARVLWNSSQMGSVELSLTDSQTGETSTETLSTNWSKLFAGVRPFASYSAFLTFTPKDGFLGKDAQFGVEIDGQMLTAGGLKFVGSVPKTVNATIKIINLEQCIQFPEAEDIVKLAEGSQDLKFSIDSSNCGATELEIALCRKDSGKCAGNAEGSIQLSKIQFSLTPEKPLQEITVFRQEIPGMYGIVVEAKVPGKSWQKIRVIDVLVEPDADAIFTMDKYAFVIKGIGSKDSAMLSNKNVVENITIDASACDWAKAAEQDNALGMLPMLGAMPLMIGVMPPLINAMGNGTRGINQAKQKTTPETFNYIQQPLLDKVTEIQDQVTDLSKTLETFKKEKFVPAKTAMSNLGKKVNELQGAIGSCDSTGVYQIAKKVAEIKTAKDSAEMQLKTCETDFFNKAMENFNSGKDAMKNAQSEVNNLSENLASTINKYKPGSPTTIASNNEAASQQIANLTKPSFDKISNRLKACSEKCALASNQLGGEGENNLAFCLQTVNEKLGKLGESITTIKESLLHFPESIYTGRETQECSALLTKITASDGIIKKSEATKKAVDALLADTGIKPITNSLNDIVNKIGNAQTPTEDSAFKVLENAKNSANQAVKDRLDAAQAMLPLQEVATRAPMDPALQQAMMNATMQAAMMGVLGSMMSGGFNAGDDSNPCNDRVQLPVTAWVIDLQSALKPITMDKPGISASWDTENIKLLGQYEKQEIGIVFENTGIEEQEPVYSTATIRATQTRHSPTVRLPSIGSMDRMTSLMAQIATSGFNGPSKVPGTTSIVTQRFHLKFVTADYIAPLPPMITENSCLQGTMIGSTGSEALPKIKLNWDWEETGITDSTCLEGTEGIYCDATQFSIMLSKRLKKLQEFIEENDNMGCPENPGVEIVREITKNYNKYLIELGLEPLPANLESMVDCWIPKSTIDLGPMSGTGSKTALEYYVEKSEVKWTAEIQDIGDLRELLRFKAFLVKDNYTSDFKRDFADYYSNKALFNAPDWFVENPSGKWADYFYSEEQLQFSRKNLDSTELLAPGLYEITLNIDFGSEWKFFDSEAKPKAKIIIVFNYLQEPYPNSVFYYLPFNSNIGRETSDGRNGYGLNYSNESEAFGLTGFGQSFVSTSVIPSSVGNTALNTSISSDAKALNSIVSTRGALLKISQGNNNAMNLVFSPNYATPIVLKMHSEQVPEKFSAFYGLFENGTPKQSGSHLAFWSAMGQCYDFTGVPLNDRFDFAPDRQASSTDSINNWQFAYGIDWDKAEKAGDVYLRTIFFTPVSSGFTLNALQPDALQFKTPDSEFQNNVELAGASTMRHNNRKSSDSVDSLQELLEMIQSGDACITNSGAEAVIWWNPSILFEAQGSTGSQKQLNESISCITS